jgi:hypothetical protein
MYKSALALYHKKDYPQVDTQKRKLELEDFVFVLKLANHRTSEILWSWSGEGVWHGNPLPTREIQRRIAARARPHDPRHDAWEYERDFETGSNEEEPPRLPDLVLTAEQLADCGTLVHNM